MGLTEELASFVASLRYEALPPPVVHEAKRSVLDFFGVALGGCRHEAVDIMEAVLLETGGKESATVIGRGKRASLLHAAMLNWQMAHVLDYDDTHLETVIHISSPVIPPLLALSESRRTDGREFIAAFVAGFEVAARVGLAISPAHYLVGWHPTGTLGTIGAAAAVGRLLGISPQQTAHAIGAASTQAAGLREMFGTMSKALHPAKAAMGGLLAALLAQKGYTSSLQALEASRGFASVLSAERNLAKAVEGLGSRWEVAENSHKPYACGVVSHPVIDAMVQIRDEAKLQPDRVERVVARVNPLVLELMGKQSPRTGLEGKFSVYHCAAVSLVDGVAGPFQYTDARVNDPTVVAVRQRVAAETEPSLREDEAWVVVTTKDGQEITRHIPHASGSRDNPMSDAGLAVKFHSMADEILGREKAKRLEEAIWHLEELEDVGSLGSLAAGQV